MMTDTKMQESIDREEAANLFAACLLMPEKPFREQAKLHTDADGKVHMKPVAEYFGVTVGDVEYRGRTLGMFKTMFS